MNRYIIAIDGGGTKTLGVIYDQHGQEIKRIECGFANFSVNVAQSKTHIQEAIDSLVLVMKKSDHLDFIQLGIAGISALKDKEAYKTSISNTYKAPVDITSDAVIALYSVKRSANQSVIMVIGGTGSIIMANDCDDIHIVGGFGHLFGEEGSGYHVAMSALKQILLEQEQGLFSPLSEKILTYINAKKRENVLDFVYNNDKSTIASLAKLIAECAIKENQDAIKLLVSEGEYLAIQTAQAFNKLKRKDTVIIALRGKFLLEAPYVKESLIGHLERLIGAFKLDENDIEPIKGAYYLATINLEKEVTL